MGVRGRLQSGQERLIDGAEGARQDQGMDPQTAAIANLLGLALVVVVIVVIIRFAVGKGVEDASKKVGRLPPIPEVRWNPAEEDGPGRYELKGVDRATKMDTTWVCQAESRANAMVKGNLEGIEVTSARKL